jgi:hypothetical protein
MRYAFQCADCPEIVETYHIEFDMRMALELVEVRDWKTGDGKLVKRFV